LHIEGSKTDSLVLGGVMEIKKLGDFENPSQRVRSIKTGDLKFDGGSCKGLVLSWIWRWWKSRRANPVTELSNFRGEVGEVLLKGLLVVE
jgi:hypothetical protein